MRALVLIDNTVLSNLALAGRPDLLLLLWPDKVCVTEDVLGEYREGAQSGHLPVETWEQLPRLRLTTEEEVMSAEWPAALGRGERSSLAVAIARGGVFASDDGYARRFARENNVQVTGTIGILVGCVRRGHLDRSAGNELLTSMIRAGYRSPISTLDTLIDA